MPFPTRRAFVVSGLAAVAVPRTLTARRSRFGDLDQFIEERMTSTRIPGLAVSVMKGGKVAWSKGYGYADIGKRTPMDPDRTIQNIGSISKTVTATALMQLVERNLVGLDEDVSRYLPFQVRNPVHPAVPITPRLLLTHRSTIVDGPAYGQSYGCGESRVELGDWLRDYLAADGELYRAANYGDWEPGTKWQYSNVGFGLLGHVVERVAGEPFRAYTRRTIFGPLGLPNTGWAWADIDASAHAALYAPIGDPKSDETAQIRKGGLAEGEPEHHPTAGEFQRICRYSFATYPDGGLRTSVNQLARVVLAYMGGGAPILEPGTVRQMLTPIARTSADAGQGLAWRQSGPAGEVRWGHNGADPGVRTNMAFRPADGVGVIVFSNRGGVDHQPILDRIFQSSDRW